MGRLERGRKQPGRRASGGGCGTAMERKKEADQPAGEATATATVSYAELQRAGRAEHLSSDTML